MDLLIASGNPHKVEEIKAIFAAHTESASGAGEIAEHIPALAIISLADLDIDIDEPVEDQPTFEGNAVLKARHYARAADVPCLADDSGLVVDALDGAPGVRSARFAGVQGPRDVVDPANNKLLLEKLGDLPAPERTARFVCVMAVVAPTESEMHAKADPRDGDVIAVVRGEVHGRILRPEETADPAHPERGRGTNGFGYDPLFFVPHLGRTTAELAPAHKNRISHRGEAARKMFRRLCELS